MNSPSDPTSNWSKFAATVQARLNIGREVYQDQTFSRSPNEVIGEIRAELADVAAYAYILDQRLARMQEALLAATAPESPPRRMTGADRNG